MRVVYFDEHESIDKLTRHKESFKTWRHVPPLSSRCELKVLHEVIKMIQTKLSEYPRTLEGDIEQFKRTDLSTNNTNALHITMGEKQALITLEESLKGVMDLIFSSKEEFLKVIPDPDELM